MSWFRRKPEQLVVPEVKFLGEQDGPPERDLKQELIELFRPKHEITAAYLAKVSYGTDPQVNVALCLQSLTGHDSRLMSEVAKVFSQKFNTHEHLDTIFIRDAQASELANVCKPFFQISK